MDEEMQMPVEERVTSNWEPLKFETGNDYDYLRNAWYQRLGTALFRRLVAFILCFYNGLVLGVKVHGRENLRALKGTGRRGRVQPRPQYGLHHQQHCAAAPAGVPCVPGQQFPHPGGPAHHPMAWGRAPEPQPQAGPAAVFGNGNGIAGRGPSSRCTRRGSWCPTPGRCGSSTMAASGWRRRPTCRCCP